MTLQDLFTKTSVAGTINPGSVFIGDKRISESEFGRVVYNN
jgi:translation initiation factor 6 (eIF-6)